MAFGKWPSESPAGRWRRREGGKARDGECQHFPRLAAGDKELSGCRGGVGGLCTCRELSYFLQDPRHLKVSESLGLLTHRNGLKTSTS